MRSKSTLGRRREQVLTPTCFWTSSAHKVTPENDSSRVLPPTRTSSKKETYVMITHWYCPSICMYQNFSIMLRRKFELSALSLLKGNFKIVIGQRTPCMQKRFIGSIKEFMSDTTQRLCTNHIVRFRSFLVYILYVSFRRRVRIAGGRFWCAACNSVYRTCSTSTLFSN